MIRTALEDEAGYSLVEAMVAIMIMAIAIIPMVSMFDTGLNVATRSGNYDTARAFALMKLEQAKSLPYTQLRDNFPRPGDTTPSPSSPATITNSTDPGVPKVPAGFSYLVSKRYKCVSSSNSSCTPPTGSPSVLADSNTDQGIIELTVTVYWGNTNSYSATGVVSRGTL